MNSKLADGIKVCPCCEFEVERERAHVFFSRDKQRADGLCTYCKGCTVEKSAIYKDRKKVEKLICKKS